MVPCGVALVFRLLPAPRSGPEGPEGDRGSFPANAGVWQPHLEPPARTVPPNHHHDRDFESRLSRSPPGTSDGRARGTGGSLQRSRSLVAGARANPKTHRTALKTQSHLSRAPPETSDRRAQAVAASGPLSRPACNEQPPARARVTLLHYAFAASIRLSTRRSCQKIKRFGAPHRTNQ